ncbi:vWA domain-containing protein [Arthrobacter cryoconiti]|uniref:VWA domain-containing protein n=1 Tax=Arthrobacter cryoconiti TaxID=748907 RepID=A0ABV8QXQ0_9MICC|nr:VWA domain-containing protein [Arthrobacter cryoconiti]MCC9069657.1 VWA domain-containing protein [Arthrobacter cryoconiti]
MNASRVLEAHSAEEILLGFASALRAGGVKVTPDRARSFVDAVSRLDMGVRADVFWAGRATLCAGPEEMEAYRRTFETWFAPVHRGNVGPDSSATTVRQASLADDGGTGSETSDEALRLQASSREMLRHRDVATLDPTERAALNRIFATLEFTLPTRRGRRKKRNRHGEIDRVRTLREQLRRGGEPGPLRRARAPRAPRRLVWLIDVSGSMAPYADSLLRLAHRTLHADPDHIEVFTLGTQLTRVSAALRRTDADDALAQAGRTVPDWSGGTRLGEVMRAFNDRWGQRAIARGAIVVIASDGWERGDPALLGRQVQRLHQLARRVIWSNPHKGKQGYEPVQQGIKAVLPFVDGFIGGHSLKSFEELLKVVGDA